MKDRALGCLLGLAIGDAMGMPASFMTPEGIKQRYGRITGFVVPHPDQIAHTALDKGEVTDDTQESLIISAVLMEAGTFDEELFIEKMKSWALDHKMLESTVIGPSTRKFLQSIINGQDYRENGKYGDTNGGAMRVAPIGIFYHGDWEEAVRHAIQSALPSHGSKPGVASTAAIAAAVAAALEGNKSPKEIMQIAIEGADRGELAGFDIPAPSVADRIRLAVELVDRNRDKTLDEICYILYRYIGAGMKSYESIPFSLGVFYAADGDVNQGIIAAVNAGDDADTNGSIVGGLCGAYSGAQRIHPEWVKKVQESNQLDFGQIAEKLIVRSGE
ncbi:ADP-ribosylglycohydrolase family protein [Brevibacillus massiliensis]|uniref:ADP-ribosylglycohydrolase family protein n=1 Tax=Brevibacillus massiliensis TaxID=1118054 RepID=UPI0002F102EB|nr:ADP-ribosylglycohydrolase family protein [Brevibacillus massiliensis]